MRVEILAIPDGCQAVAIEQSQYLPTAQTRYVSTAVCGDRGPVYSAYETMVPDRPLNSPAHEDVVQSAREDLSALVGAMCLGCPNRSQPEAESATEPANDEPETGVSADEPEGNPADEEPQEGELTRNESVADEPSTDGDDTETPRAIETSTPLAIDGAAATDVDD